MRINPFIAYVSATVSLMVVGCASDQYSLTETPNYDHLMGKQFSQAIPHPGRLGFKNISEKGGIEELEERRSDGCTTTFGVRKTDGVLTYWRVSPSPEACKVRREALNR